MTVNGVDDTRHNGTRTGNIVSAAAVSADTAYSGLDTADVALTVTDNDAERLTISFAPNPVNEGAVTVMTVSHNNDLQTTALTVNLSTDYVTPPIDLPATITIPAGQSSVSFNLTATENFDDFDFSFLGARSGQRLRDNPNHAHHHRQRRSHAEHHADDRLVHQRKRAARRRLTSR